MLKNRLKELRMARKISQKDFANSLGVSQQTVASWEVGRTEPSTELLKKIATVFQVSIDYLLDNENAQNVQKYHLSNEQKTLLNEFDSLNTEGQNIILSMLNSLRITHAGGAFAI